MQDLSNVEKLPEQMWARIPAQLRLTSWKSSTISSTEHLMLSRRYIYPSSKFDIVSPYSHVVKSCISFWEKPSEFGTQVCPGRVRSRLQGKQATLAGCFTRILQVPTNFSALDLRGGFVVSMAKPTFLIRLFGLLLPGFLQRLGWVDWWMYSPLLESNGSTLRIYWQFRSQHFLSRVGIEL